ncbi:MAG: glycine cleavage system protein GcvH [Eggerthellaceae bacterium]|nr:glycine cleavage system protein GcvH [Eggerthellaceae bacterium]
MEFPNDRTYTATHEWLQDDGSETTIGITDFAQASLGDLVFINLPEPGDEVVAGQAFADVESVKSVSEIVSPVSGVVAEVNEDLLDSPELANQNAYDAWFIKVDMVSETLETFDADEYQARFID